MINKSILLVTSLNKTKSVYKTSTTNITQVVRCSPVIALKAGGSWCLTIQRGFLPSRDTTMGDWSKRRFSSLCVVAWSQQITKTGKSNILIRPTMDANLVIQVSTLSSSALNKDWMNDIMQGCVLGCWFFFFFFFFLFDICFCVVALFCFGVFCLVFWG